ncbi:hypothetical protein KA005_02130 [bacterium]|nr:hypothetical protein [bacterium]
MFEDLKQCEVEELKFKGYLKNCYIEGRPSDGTLFFTPSDCSTIECALDGYAILPIERYKILDAFYNKNGPQKITGGKICE